MSSSFARDGILNADTHRVPTKGRNHLVHDNNRTQSPAAADDDDVKNEDGAPDVRMGDAKPTYKSWKKKYRKMRIQFDMLQTQNEELYQLEQKALRKTKQLASYNEYGSSRSLPRYSCCNCRSATLITFPHAAACWMFSWTSTIARRSQ